MTVGPPLLNVRRELPTWRFTADGRTIGIPRIATLDRTQRCTFRADAGAATFAVTAGGRTTSAPIGADLAPSFAGTRALMTLQLDNDLEWIRDWVSWHVRTQGTDAVVVYDNGSSRYTLDDILDTISGVPGLRVVCVVDWAFRYGPQGGDGIPWDSDYAQYGAIEHAYRRMFRRAAGVLSIDIDELVHSPAGVSIYDEAAASPQGFALFGGEWRYADPAAPSGQPRHIDCRFTRSDDAPAATKWCAVPSRLPRGAQLAVHEAYGLMEPPLSSSAYWHMRPISTHWKIDRSGAGYDPSAFALDPETASLLDAVLGQGESMMRPLARRRVPLTSRARAAWHSATELPAATERRARDIARAVRDRARRWSH